MFGKWRYVTVLFVMVVGLVAGCVRVERDSAEPPTGRSVELRVIEGQAGTLAFVPVTINDAGPFMFALDTGASASVIDSDIAEELSLPRTGEQRAVTGIIGMQRVEISRVEQWSIDGARLEPTDIAVIDLPEPQGGLGLRGLLGSDVLSDFGRILIDYDNQRLHLPED